MPQGLPVSRLITVSVSLSPTAAPNMNFETLVIIGDSNIINVKDRIRTYNTFNQLALDFPSNTPEYQAAQLFFNQNPQPGILYVGRWAQSATAGLLVGGVLSATQQAIATWNAVTAGGFKIQVDATSVTNVTGLNFSSDTNLNGVASRIQAAIVALGAGFTAVTVAWNSVYQQFTIQSGTTGTASLVAPLIAPTAGTDISPMLKATAATLTETVQGIAAESALTATTILDNNVISFYGVTFASTHIVTADHLAIAGYIEASGNKHIYGLTYSDSAALVSGDTTSIAYQMKQLAYNRTCYQFSSTTLYAIASLFGRALTVDFEGNNTTITLMYQNEPGVIPENLTTSQAAALDSTNNNYFTNYNNGVAIIENGIMASGQFFDTIIGTDWLAADIQNGIFNALHNGKKIPQTDPGNNVIKTVITSACDQGVTNGLLAPGQWNAPGFGNLATGQYLPLGYYVYAPPIATQNQADRAGRKSVPFQVAAKGAGAIHFVNVAISFNP